jgi:hypothetical protein
MKEPLVWTLDPNAEEHFEDCIRRSKEKPKTFAEWGNWIA